MTGPLFDFAAKRAELSPQRLAFVQPANGHQVTYAELDSRVGQCAGLLAELGLKRGERVAVLCRNRIEFFEILLACGRAGLIAVPLNWRMPATELTGLLADCDPRLLVFGSEDEAAALATRGPPQMQQLALDEDGREGYRARCNGAPVVPGNAPWPADQVWYLLYTSGTTGRPKAVVQTFAMAMANMINISQGMGLREDDVSVCFLPLFHTGGINLLTMPFLLLGATTLVLPGFDANQLVALLAERKISVFFGVPAIYQALALHPEFDQLDLSAVRSWACGGAPLPDILVQQYAAAGALVCNGMGMTETGPTLFLMDRDHVTEKPGSVGKPQLLSQVRLVANGADVTPGQTGELWFAGQGITPGYWQQPEATAAAFSGDGWLRSGDLGRRDDDGYYYIVGRLKDMYISGGENVYPAEVENVLAAHADVLEAAVVGVSDARWGEVGRAYVLPRPGHDMPSDEQLRQHCRALLAGYKVPVEFIAVSEFPRTAAGKVQKHLLVDRASA